MSLCGPLWSCQIKDILKGALRFNQSLLEAEENEEISIADDHYTLTAAAENALSSNSHHSDHQQEDNSRPSRDSDLDGSVSTDEKEEEEQATPPEQQASSRWILHSVSSYVGINQSLILRSGRINFQCLFDCLTLFI